MKRCYHMAPAIAAVFGLAACGTPAPPPVSHPAAATTPRDLLGHIVERYWDDAASLSPWYSWGAAEGRYGDEPADAISPQALADALSIERRSLAELQTVSRTDLDPESKLTYDAFLRERLLTIESFTYPAELMPVNPYDAMPQRFASMASAAESAALANAKDLEVWKAAAVSYVAWVDQAVLNLKEGLRRGYVLPRVVVEKTLPVLAALGNDSPGNIFYLALAQEASASVPGESRPASQSVIVTAVKDDILPAYRRLHDFLERDYLPRARDNVGIEALPLGRSWYAHLAKRATNSLTTPAALHALGLAEIERVRVRLRALVADTAYAGNPSGFFDAMRRDPGGSSHDDDESLEAYRQLKVTVAAAASAFVQPPKADFDIRPVEAFRHGTTPDLFYRRSLAYGRTPAVLYVDTARRQPSPVMLMTSQYLREAVPGHHSQLALQQERMDLPKFRRFGGAPGFIDGWASYAASLGDELEVYHDAEARFGGLLTQLRCAVGMVIDTGIHAQNWSRQQAVDFYNAEVPGDHGDAADAVDRDLALPGDALACAGGLKIQDLRTRVQQALGARFDVRAFHTELLRNGAVPLDLLDAAIKPWLDNALKSD